MSDKAKGKRIPAHDTRSLYSDSTVSIKNIEFPDTFAEIMARKPPQSKFERKSPRKTELVIRERMPKKYEKETFCETELGTVKKLCQKMDIKPTFKTDNFKTCKQNEPLAKLLYRNITRKEFCLDKILSSETKSSATGTEQQKTSSQEEKQLKLEKSYERISKDISIATTETSPTDTKEIHRLLTQRIKLPCPETEAGSLRHKFVGKCSNKDMLREKKEPYDKIKQVIFTRTENAQTLSCLKNPNYKGKKISTLKERKREKLAEEAYIKQNVKLADNVETSSEDENPGEDKICEEIDLDNPFNLDFQGFDYQNTFKTDEQDFENIREYRKIKRYADRNRRQKDIVALCKEEDEIRKFAIPEYFDTNIMYDSFGEAREVSPRNVYTPTNSSQSGRLGKLYRTEKKSLNRFIIEKEEEQRDGRLRNLVLKKKEHDEAIEKERKVANEEFEENKVVLLAEKHFNGLYEDDEPFIFEELKKNIEEKKRTFPHTLAEVKQFRHKMKKTKIVVREKGALRQKFYEDLGSSKQIPEANLYISDLSESQTTITEKSSNDDDNIKVGQVDDKYYLRGFHFRLGSEIRGKYATTDMPPESRVNRKGCMTRNEWIDALAPHKRKKALYQRNPPEILKTQKLDDPKLNLFPQKPIVKTGEVEHPIRQEIAKPFGNQYKVSVKKVIKIKKPKTLKVKKFNLTNFLFGDEKNRMNNASIDSNHFGRVHKGFGNLTEYIRNKDRLKNAMRRRKRYQRMHYLGIPRSLPKLQQKIDNLCERTSDSSESDWVPEEYKSFNKIESQDISTRTFGKSNCTPYVENILREFDHMPAPSFREPVIRRDPNKPRDLTHQLRESAILEATHTDIPYLKMPEDDKNVSMRLDEPKKEFMTFLNARHHFDHWDPTQHKDLIVLYKPKYPDPKITEDLKTSTKQIKMKKKSKFDKATPSHIQTRDIDLSLPGINTDALIKQIKGKEQTKEHDESKDVMKVIEYPNRQEIYSSKARPLPEYPGKEEFIQLIKDLNTEIKRQEKARGKAGADDAAKEKLESLLNKDEFMEQLKDELRSIKSCLSSLDSSICTNFTDDSGSFLVAADKKVPMDYIRKALVPFEEINRTRIKAVPIPQNKHNANPYETVPYAGQAAEQIIKPEDKFHTAISRLHNDMRGRLHVPTVDISKIKLGIRNCKSYKPKVATDLDETYIDELHNRPPVKLFRAKTSRYLIKDAQRKKYICWCIQQKLVEQKSAEEKQFIYYNSVLKMKNLFGDLFLKWQKTHYDDLKEVECKIEPYYATTDELRKHLHEFDKQIVAISMNIVYIENTLIKLTVLQNFHYLLMDEAWRRENDWLHKNDNGELENFRESIEKRPFANVRKRDRDNAWAIKEFYENEFINCKLPIITCFPDAESFNAALGDLKSKTFVCLLELHFILWLQTNLEHEYNQVLIWAESCNQQRDKFIETKGVKKTFMQKRGKILQDETEDLINEPLAESVSAISLRKIKAFGEVLFEKLVPWSIRQSIKDDVDVNDTYALISESLLDLLAQIDEIPKDIRDSTNINYRKRLKYDTQMSIKAVEVENRISNTLNTVQRLLKPIKLKSRKEIMAKYGRMKLKKRRVTEGPKEEPIPEKTKFFYKAFHDDKDVSEITRADQYDIEKHLAGIEEESITFYFDHFLRLNDYEPNYNFKTQIEITDGPEENYMKYKELIPLVKQEVAAWEENRKIQLKKHIEENPKLYTDIKT